MENVVLSNFPKGTAIRYGS